jgi:hypothetical protein
MQCGTTLLVHCAEPGIQRKMFELRYKDLGLTLNLVNSSNIRRFFVANKVSRDFACC